MYRVLLISILGTLFFSALVTPALYAVLLHFWPELPWPYSRVFDRVAMLVLFLYLLFYRREFELGNVWAILRKGVWQQKVLLVGGALSLSFCLSLAAVPFIVGNGELVWREENWTAYYAWKVARFLPAALLISVIEESFFRFLLFDFLKERMRWILAAGASSALYAAVHFITPDKKFVFEGWSLFIGFEYLLVVAGRVVAPGLLAALFGLFLVGMSLCLLMQRYRSIYFCIGLHMGWILVVKALGYLTTAAPGYSFPPGAGRRYYLVSTYAGWISIVLVASISALVLHMLTRRSCLHKEKE